MANEEAAPPITGDRVLTDNERADIELHRQTLRVIGFLVKAIVTSKDGYTKYLSDLVPNTDSSKAREALDRSGFDSVSHREDGRISWQITKRTRPGKGWE